MQSALPVAWPRVAVRGADSAIHRPGRPLRTALPRVQLHLAVLSDRVVIYRRGGPLRYPAEVCVRSGAACTDPVMELRFFCSRPCCDHGSVPMFTLPPAVAAAD